jgi:hypothetical protein
MAFALVRNFDYPAGNISMRVRADAATGAVTFGLEPLDPDLPTDESFFAGPNDGYQDGDPLQPSSCQLDPDGNRTGVELELVARNAQPYAELLQIAGSAACTPPNSCSLDASVSYDTVNGFVVLSVTGVQGGGWSSSGDNVTFLPNQTNYPAAPGATGYLYVQDQQGCAKRVAYVMPTGGSGTVPPGEIIESFSTSGEDIDVYYDPATRQLAHTQAPGTVNLPDPLSEAQRGRTDGEFISQRCEGTTQVRFYATLSAPFVRLETTENSTACGYTPPAALAITATGTAPTTAGGTGSLAATPTGGTAPLTVEVLLTGQSKPGTAGQVTAFPGLAPGGYVVRVTDSATPPRQAEAEANVPPYVAPVVACGDQDAINYVPGGTDNSLCRYVPRWVGAWARGGVPVPVRLSPADIEAGVGYLTAALWAGFPAGHPLAAERPLSYILDVRATVGPDGVARFDLAPYLRPLLGSAGIGGVRRLDLNSPDAHTADLYVGWALYIGSEKMAHGYALNSALDEPALEQYRLSGAPLSPFGPRLPVWPGFTLPYSVLTEDVTGRLGQVAQGEVQELSPPGDVVVLPCPSNPLPVAWLAPDGSFAYWVFQGRHDYGDEVGEGQGYVEGGTEERRYSSRGASYRTVTAWSGVFSSRALVEGLRTLRRAVQVWYRPDPLGPWVPVVLGSGSVPAYREGRQRYEMTITFSEALPVAVQGQ